ncbi:MAG: ArnT family glycosyltransferase [Chthoniobacteraceae bacterium]
MNHHGTPSDLLPHSPVLAAAAREGTRMISRLWLLLLASLLVMLTARLAGPSAMQRFDQPKTVAYTASMVLHHQWLLPDDMLGGLSTKPPLVNWLAAPWVALGFWSEWAVKLPMLVASICTLLMVVGMGRHLLVRCTETAAWAREGGLLAGLAWLTTPATMESLYHCRPDPVLVAFLVAAWALATLALDGSTRHPRRVALGLWVAVGLAGLTKGPPALLPILYVPLAARFLYGEWAAAHRTGWKWGVPLALAMMGGWLVPVALLHPDHFSHVLLGQELLSRVAGVGVVFGDVEKGGGTLRLLTGLYLNPVWLVEKMFPWSLAALAALWVLRPGEWFRHPLGPAILWVLLVLFFFSLTASKTADYILPAYPAVAMLSAYFCVRVRGRWQLWPVAFGAVGLLLAVGLSVQAVKFSSAAREPYGENTKQFAREVASKVGNDSLVFVATGYNTLQFFLARHQPGAPSPEALTTAKWIIQPVCRGLKAELLSDKIPNLSNSGKPGRVALYRADDRVLAEARKLAGLNSDGNP